MFNLIKKNILSLITALLIMYLSLAPSYTFDDVPVPDLPNIDKVVHFGMYFTLMMALLFEHRSTNKKLPGQVLMAIIPLLYGIVMELSQAYFTATRYGDVLDAAFNFIGIAFAILSWRLFLRFSKRAN
jgi:VanZ family protein